MLPLTEMGKMWVAQAGAVEIRSSTLDKLCVWSLLDIRVGTLRRRLDI